MRPMKTLTAGLAAAFATLTATAATAQEGLEIIGAPQPGGLNFQPAATDIAVNTQGLDNLLLWIITAISLFVGALILIIIVRYNRRANPTPGTFTHHTGIEITWTLVPIVILVIIGSFSLPVLFQQQVIPEGEVHIKVTGYQWYWGYEYTDHEFGFDSYAVGHAGTLTSEDEAAGAVPFVMSDAMEVVLERHGYTRNEFLLATDTAVVVPTGKVVVMDVTGADVIHSWTIPAFGVKQDAVPGRIAQLWFEVEPGKEGIYFGQCSELCGKDHAYMPITVKAVTPAEYEAWLEGAKAEYAGVSPLLTVASAN